MMEFLSFRITLDGILDFHQEIFNESYINHKIYQQRQIYPKLAFHMIILLLIREGYFCSLKFLPQFFGGQMKELQQFYRWKKIYYFRKQNMGLPDLFTITNKGLPTISPLPSSIQMPRSFYVNSILLQVVILLVFVLYFIVSIYRVVKKIKNHRFQEIPEEEKKEEDEANRTELDAMNQHQIQKEKENQQPQNLIYRFDEEEDESDLRKTESKEPLGGSKMDMDSMKNDPLKDEKEDKSETKSDKSINSNSYDDYHDENEEAFIEMDDKLLFVQPFLISFVISNNFFSTDAISLAAIVLLLGAYYMFNIKGHCGKVKILSLLFMVCSLAGYIPFFIHDHDVTT